MSDYRSHLSVTIWAALLVLALGSVLILPERVFSADLLGSPLSFTLSTDIFVALVALTVICSGLEAAIRTHPRQAVLHDTYRYWGLPSAVVVAAAAVLPAAPSNALWLVALAFSGLVLAAAAVAEYHTVDADDPHYHSARLVLNMLAYTLAALAFVLVYGARSRSLISATAIGIMAGLLAMDLLREADRPLRLILLFSGIIALAMAQSTWVFNYWPFASMRVGLVLLVEFYLIVGLVGQELMGHLTRRRAIEYILLALVAMALMLWFPV